MLKKIACAAAATAVMLFCGSAPICAEEKENLLNDYKDLLWSGDQVYYDAYSTSIYFKKSDKDVQSASVTLELEQGASGFMFRIDGGNGAGEGLGTDSGIEDSGFCTFTFYDDAHNSLFGVSTGVISGLENYTRFSVGKEEKYYPVPDGAKTAEIVISANQKGKTDNVHMYFRNFALFFSNEVPLMAADNDTLYMEASSGLSRVEVGISSFDRYLWIGIIFAVAMVFFGISLWRQKYKTAKVMKGTDWKKR